MTSLAGEWVNMFVLQSGSRLLYHGQEQDPDRPDLRLAYPDLQ